MCSTYDHFTEEQIREHQLIPDPGWGTQEAKDRQEDYFMNLEYELGYTHKEKLAEHLEKFEPPSAVQSGSCKRFAKCKEVCLSPHSSCVA